MVSDHLGRAVRGTEGIDSGRAGTGDRSLERAVTTMLAAIETHSRETRDERRSSTQITAPSMIKQSESTRAKFERGDPRHSQIKR